MAVSLKQAATAERAAKEAAKARLAPVPETLDGVALMREIAGAIRAARGASILTDSERDALAQAIAERVTRTNVAALAGRPAQVLAWIDRAERLPLWAAQAERIPRGSIGRDFLRNLAERLLRESREWRDLAQTYSVRERSQRERSGPTVTLESWEHIEASESGTVTLEGAMARERAARPHTDRAPLPEASAELCAAWADSLALTEAQTRYVRYALLTDLAGVPADVIAAREDRGLRVVLSDSNRGRTIVRSLYRTSRAMIAAGTEIAEREGLTQRDPQRERPQLDSEQAEALAVIGTATRSERDLAKRYRPAVTCGPQAGSAAQVLAWVDLVQALAAAERSATPVASYVPHARHLRAARQRVAWPEPADSDRTKAEQALAQRAAERAARKQRERPQYRALMDAVAAERATVTAAGADR